MNEVKYWLETATDSSYTLSIYYDSHSSAWGLLIEMMETEKMPSQVVGEIACNDPTTFQFIEEKISLRQNSFLSQMYTVYQAFFWS